MFTSLLTSVTTIIYTSQLQHYLFAKFRLLLCHWIPCSSESSQLNSVHLYKGLEGMLNPRSIFYIKRMGEVDRKAFQDICQQSCTAEDWEEKSATLCSLWERRVRNARWHPFKRITIDGKLQVHFSVKQKHQYIVCHPCYVIPERVRFHRRIPCASSFCILKPKECCFSCYLMSYIAI